MKKTFTLLVAVLFTAIVIAQAPEKLSYQAVIRNNSNQLVSNKAIGMKISLVRGSALGLIVYSETHMPTTNSNGLINIEIGGGTVLSGNFVSNDWSNGPYFIQTDIDPEGGDKYTISGTTQLLSVPYALYAKTSGGSHFIGEHYLGGIVFYVYDYGQHGLIAAKEDTHTISSGKQMAWSSSLNECSGARGYGVGAGLLNTAIIVADQNSGNFPSHFAANVCIEYRVKEGEVFFSNWYLPSKFELQLLYLQKNIVGGFQDFPYWTSTEDIAPYAWAVDFSNGNALFQQDKTDLYFVRAIHAF